MKPRFRAGTALILAGCLAITTASCSKHESEDPTAQPATETAATTTETAPATSTSKKPTTSKKPSKTTSAGKKANPNKGAPPAGVGTFNMDGPAPIVGATYDSMPYVLPLNPAGPQATMVRWVDGWGQSPATAEQGTTYVLGHAWGQQHLVFNPISEFVTANVDMNNPTPVPSVNETPMQRFVTDALNGSTITMEGPSGARSWVVDTAYLVDKNTAGFDKKLVNEHEPGRIVLIACSVDGNQDLNYNVVVEGHLK